ncbi:unnamed protein product [Peronospora belbahrii]|uniref:DUF1279 domain-containing protein n=1 Tax=Peronospora belbahrii TaxID=622444 RepID=A0ABN8D8J1_9STRA|nr:unnamed protein product [Peronospora belbahrii]
MMLRGGMRYFCAYPGTAQQSMGFRLSIRYHWIQTLSISSNCVAISSSLCRSPPGALTTVPCRLSRFPSPFTIHPRSNYGIVRLFSSSRKFQEPRKEKVPLTENEPTSPIKIDDDVEKEIKKPVEKVQLLSWRQRAKTFAIVYGRVGICTHIVLSLLSFSTIYVVSSSGVDVQAILDSIGVSASAATNSAGSVLIAYTLYKVLTPVRWALTFAVTPVILRALRRRGYMLATTVSPSSPSPPPQ